jgi:SAM-dependent methyltransferase
MLEILAFIAHELAAGAAELAFCVLDPDLGRGRYAGEHVEHAGERHVHRPLRAWLDLAERLELRLRTPVADRDGLIRLRFERLDRDKRWQADHDVAPAARERYGAASGYARIAKLEDPGFVIDLGDAVARARLGSAPRVLDLGVNTGDELAVIARSAPDLRVTGIDHSGSALAIARARFPSHQFIESDLGALAALELGVFDLVISLNTLQSPGLDDRAILRRIVQHHLAPAGAVILGLPNVRYLDGEPSYGARMKNFRQPELGLLVKDLAFYRKYLQQHGRQVFITGKHTVLVTGVVSAPDPAPGEGSGDGSGDASGATLAATHTGARGSTRRA